MQATTVRLRRFTPPFYKTVVVERIRVGAFFDLVTLFATNISAFAVKVKKDVSPYEWMKSVSDPAFFSEAVDCLVRDQPPGFFLKWLSLPNVNRIIAATVKIDDWERLMAVVHLDTPDEKPKDRIGLMAQLQYLCKVFAIDPMDIRSKWTMHDFLVFCDSLAEQMAKAEEIEDAPASDAELVADGLSVVH